MSQERKTTENDYTVSLEILENCVIEKILQNRLNNLASIDSDYGLESSFDWDVIFNGRHVKGGIFTPGLRPRPPLPKLTVLTKLQHKHCLVVICYRNRHILPGHNVPPPTDLDYSVYEEAKAKYIREQQEYIARAEALLANGQSLRALTLALEMDNVFTSEFRLRSSHIRECHVNFHGLIHFSLEADGDFRMELLETFQDVKISNLPLLQYPAWVQKRFSVQRSRKLRKRCPVHPARFVLPGEKKPTTLTPIEVNTELARYAAARGVWCVAREGALQCLVENRPWALTVSVCAVPGIDGVIHNVIVLGKEITFKPEDPYSKKFKAYRRHLENSFVLSSELSKWSSDSESGLIDAASNDNIRPRPWMARYTPSNIYADTKVFIFGLPENNNREENNAERNPVEEASAEEEVSQADMEIDNIDQDEADDEGCTCKHTVYGKLPPRSFRKWRFRNNTTSENIDVMVHCSHKFGGPNGEMLLEPICEYQDEVGASPQRESRLRCLALSVALRDNARVLNVRIDKPSGEVTQIQELTVNQQEELQSPARIASAQTAIHTAFHQLKAFEPGHYILTHEADNGDYTLLYTEPYVEQSRDEESSSDEGTSRTGSSRDGDCSSDGDLRDMYSSSETGFLDDEPDAGSSLNADRLRHVNCLDAAVSRDEHSSCDADGSRDADSSLNAERGSSRGRRLLHLALRDAAAPRDVRRSSGPGYWRDAGCMRDQDSSSDVGGSSDAGPSRYAGSSHGALSLPVSMPSHKDRDTLQRVVSVPRPRGPPRAVQWTKKKGGKKNLRPH